MTHTPRPRWPRTVISALAVMCAATAAGVGPAVAGASEANGRIAFTAYHPKTDSSRVVTMNPDGTSRTRLRIPVDGSRPVWSPDGSRLLIGTYTEKLGGRPATVNPDGSGLKILKVPGLPANMDIGQCVWIPHTTRILCMARNFSGQKGADTSRDGIYSIVARDGSNPVRLTVNRFPASGDFGGGDIPGDVSPDGKHFVFMRAKPNKGPGPEQSGALFVKKIAGSGLHRITKYGLPNSHDNGVERWSPHRNRILFGSEKGRLFTIRPDGTELTRVRIRGASSDSFAYAPGWSPDGSRIVTGIFVPSTRQADIYTLHADGHGLARLTHTGNVDAPDWGPAAS